MKETERQEDQSPMPDLRLLSREEAARLERQLIPFLNALRAFQGKRPVIIPNDNRAHN